MRGIFRTAVAILSLFSHTLEAHSVKRNAIDYYSRVDDPILQTPSHRVHAHSSFEITFLLHNKNQKVRLSLEPNHDVISDSATIQYLNPDGTVRHQEAVDRSDHKVFKGTAFIQQPGHSEWANVGWARITVHRDGGRPIFEGAFRVMGDHHHVQTSTNYRKTQHHGDPVAEFADDEYMVVWRDSDIRQDHDGMHEELKRGLNGASTCSSDRLDFNNLDTHPIFSGLDLRDTSAVESAHLFGRQQVDGGSTSGNSGGVNLASTIGSTEGCPTTRKVALVGIATDCTYTAQFSNDSTVRQNIIQQVNTASELYESTFNISLGIQNLTISARDCPGTEQSTAPWNQACSSSVDITDRLNLFSAWRGQRTDTNAYWTLLSTCNTDSAVGLAWLGQLCTQGSSGGDGTNETTAGANVVVRTSTEWQVFAHETGHTFGAVHDCTSTTCSDGTVGMQRCCPLSSSSCDAGQQFIMNPSTGSSITRFSACSIGNICSAMARNSVKSSCLANNKDVVTITGSQCGNGIVESGEDCDCGGVDGCGDNSCCDAKTCKFKGSAVCDPSNEDCCTAQCQFASQGTVCRASTGTCDPQEVCTGNAPNCPADQNAPDGDACGASGAGLTCASGQCTSRDLQCETIVGSLTTDNDTRACNSQGCLLSCASSSLGPNTCYDMRQYFLDGTPCQGGGQCRNGVCSGASFVNEVSSWINDNKSIVIPVAGVIGGLILIAILSCIVSCCRRRRRAKKFKPTMPTSSWQGGTIGVPPPSYAPYREAASQWGGGRRMRSMRYA